MLKIIATKNSSFTMLDARIVKSVLARNKIHFTDFKTAFDSSTFCISKEDSTTDNFYRACIMLDAIYNIKLQHPNIITVESMFSILATNFLQD